MTEATAERIADRCPSCGHTTLFIGSRGFLTCSWLPCSEPGVGRSIKRIQERLASIGSLPQQVCKLSRHVCGNCDFSEEERVEIEGFNAGIAAALAVVQRALAVDGGLIESPEAAVPSKSKTDNPISPAKTAEG